MEEPKFIIEVTGSQLHMLKNCVEFSEESEPSVDPTWSIEDYSELYGALERSHNSGSTVGCDGICEKLGIVLR